MPADFSSAASIADSNGTKRKATRQNSLNPPANANATAPASTQQTISQHFTTATHKPSVQPSSPSNKRLKPNPPGSVPRPSQIAPLAADKMYNFSSRNAASRMPLIDLTVSPESTPSPRKTGVSRQPFNPHTGAKKLVVRNLKTKERADPRKYFDQVWTQLDSALNAIFKSGKNVQNVNGSLGASLEELYRGAENVCRQGFAEQLCEKLQVKMEEHVGSGLVAPLKRNGGKMEVDLLKAVLEAWEVWRAQLKLVISIFFYLDRSYLLPKSQSIQTMGVDLFHKHASADTELWQSVLDGPCQLVAMDREGKPIKAPLLRQALSLLHDLHIYTSQFEPRFLASSQTYVIDWVDKHCENDLSAYVQDSFELMDREMKRCDAYQFDHSTRRALLNNMEYLIVERKVDRLTDEADFAKLLDRNAADVLAQLYNLLDRRNLALRLKGPFEKWVLETGTQIVFSDKEQDQMVTRLLTLKRQLDTIWRDSFQKNEALGHALREAFETFINKTRKSNESWGTDNSKVGEYIAKYVDMLLRGGVKAIPASLNMAFRKRAGSLMSAHTPNEATEEKQAEQDEEEELDEDQAIDDQLDQVLDLFRFLHGKAVFEAFYKKDLAKRLLMGRSADEEKERGMLSRLKTECGSGFTQNLEQMFNDISLSREELESYHSLQAERQQSSPIDLSVHVLAASAWPTYPDIPVAIPPDVKTAIDAYGGHYQSKHRGRKLTWKHALSHCQIKANFPKARKELVVSCFQAVVLLYFNNVSSDEKVSYETLKAATQLPETDLKRTLQSLACAKLRPLTKHPKGRDISSTDSFSLNLNFTHDKYRLKINQVQQKETKEENKATHERVAEDRNFETQAAIVRIMKARKKIAHSELIAEVISATRSRGVLPVADIKKNIDKLIDKDYMEREEGNTYQYLA